MQLLFLQSVNQNHNRFGNNYYSTDAATGSDEFWASVLVVVVFGTSCLTVK